MTGMKPPLSNPDRAQVRQLERHKAMMVTRVIEETAATIAQHMAETEQEAGKFFWDGVNGDFASSALLTNLLFTVPEGSITVQARLRNEEWTHAVAVNLPDHALKSVFDRLHSVMTAVHFKGLTTMVNTVH